MEPSGSIEISVVIPTRNRAESLLQTLACLLEQTHPLEEIIVVDSSDEPVDLDAVHESSNVPIVHVRSTPSVCRQRNIGISKARADYVFLCDDDMDLPADYVDTLAQYIRSTGATAVSGLWYQMAASGEWVYEYPVTSFAKQLWIYIFQLSAWGSMRLAEPGRMVRPLSERIAAYYEVKGNDVSLAGWPVVTQFGGDVIRTRVYSLGASIVAKRCFDSNLFDEILDPHGLGDNYGVALGLPEKLHVLKAAPARHRQSPMNRLPPQLAAYRRTLALHYFLTLKSTRRARMFLIWSLIGLLLLALPRDRLRAKAVAKSLALIASGSNPYLVARSMGRKFVEPAL